MKDTSDHQGLDGTDELLLLSCKSASEAEVKQVIEELICRHHAKLVNFLFRFTGDLATAEDLTQETFMRLFRHARTYKPKAKVKTWIFTIGVNLAKNELRNRKKRAHTMSGVKDHQPQLWDPTAPAPDEAALREETQQQVRTAITQLPFKYREVVILCDIQGQSYEEAAEVLDVKLGTVKTRLNRARIQLAEKLTAVLGKGGA